MSAPLAFIPTRVAALARLAEFLPDAGRYAADRNFVRPGHPNISRLSPWVQKRLLLVARLNLNCKFSLGWFVLGLMG